MKRCVFLILLATAAAPCAEPGAVDVEKEFQERIGKARGTFELAESPITDALQLISKLYKVTVVIERGAFENTDEPPLVNANCKDVGLAQAIELLTDQIGFDYLFQDEAVFIFKKGRYKKPSAGTQSAPVALSAEESSKLKLAIQRLGSETFSEREEANAQISKYGKEAREQLEAARKTVDDPEAMARIRALLDDMSGEDLPKEPDAMAAALKRFSESTSVEFEDVPLADALNQVLENHRGEFELRPNDSLGQEHVTLIAINMRTDNVLRWLARQAGAELLPEGEKIVFAAKEKKLAGKKQSAP